MAKYTQECLYVHAECGPCCCALGSPLPSALFDRYVSGSPQSQPLLGLGPSGA